jgi:hypothetical protein
MARLALSLHAIAKTGRLSVAIWSVAGAEL